MTDADLAGLALMCGVPALRARFKHCPDDFVVRERLGFAPSGAGEHVYLHLRKTGANTAWVAAQLAEFAGVAPADVSYAGRKDRHGVTEQWFSCWLPGRDMPDWQALDLPGIEVLETRRHDRKLRRGEHAGNDFEVRLRQLTPVSRERLIKEQLSKEHVSTEFSLMQDLIQNLEDRLLRLRDKGMPNYFGPQRFGRGGGNLARAEAMFAGARVGREQRSLYLSAVRSQLFNIALSDQLRNGTLPPAESLAGVNPGREQNRHRSPGQRSGEDRGRGRAPAAPGPQGWLYGTTRRPNEALQAMAQAHPEWCAALEAEGLKAQQRALWVMPENLTWRLEPGEDGRQHLWLAFGLPTGSYATSLIREIVLHGEG